MLKESLREVLREERLALFLLLIPYISDKEMIEIETKFGSPVKYEETEFIDITDWVKSWKSVSVLSLAFNQTNFKSVKLISEEISTKNDKQKWNHPHMSCLEIFGWTNIAIRIANKPAKPVNPSNFNHQNLNTKC